VLPLSHMPVDQQAPVEDSGEAVGNPPMVLPPESDAGAASPPAPTGAPVDDPSLIEGVKPVKKEDTRSRF
jgi:hypothetical protein